VKFIKSHRLGWYGRVERVQSQRMPKQIATATMEGTRTRRTPHKRWKDKIEKNLNIMRIRHRQAMTRDRQEWRKIVLEAKVHNGLYCLR
jgi:hypothetical protein